MTNVLEASASAPTNEERLNLDQERIVRHLAETVRRELAGEDVRHPGDRKFITNVKPSRTLQLGVLRPLPAPDPPADDDEESSDGTGSTDGAAGEQLDPHSAPIPDDFGGAPPTMGLDFVVEPVAGKAVIELGGHFAVYVQRYPELNEQRKHWAIEIKEDGTVVLPEQAPPEDEDAGDDTGADDVSNGDKGKKKRRRRQRQMSLFPKYERFDIDLGAIRVELDATETVGTQDIDGKVQQAIDAVLGPVLQEADTVYQFQSGRQTLVAQAAATDDADWKQAIKLAEGSSRVDRPLMPHRARFNVRWRRDKHGHLRVHVTLSNESVAPRRSSHDRSQRELDREMHLFNTSLRAREVEGAFLKTDFIQAPEDFRYDQLRTVWVHGRNAAAEGIDADGHPVDPDGARPVELRTTTWPIFRQRKLVPNPDIEVEFARLADPAEFRGVLGNVEAAMRQFASEWEAELTMPHWGGDTDPRGRACRRSLDTFEDEVRRFSLGLRALDEDARLRRAFVESNGVFQLTSAKKGITSWRLFQLVYHVIHLAALRARETDEPAFVSELDTADVLFYPTGGGKTEAYLGLITTALFYDRLRGKKLGVSAILRFPLRMLSVQQLSRVGTIVYAAEQRRAAIELETGDMAGDPFRLGYYVGQGNTPNSISGPKSWQKGSILWWADHIKDRPEEALRERVITECLNPSCPGGEVTLQADIAEVRLKHVCSVCGDLPVFHTDDEVFRYAPAVTVATVDKLAAVGRVEHVSHLISGPARECPKHGYFTYLQPHFENGTFVGADRCLAGSLCKEPAASYRDLVADDGALGPKADVYDPVPAIQVQDEMHLLQEELGTFDAHYETIYEHLQRWSKPGGTAKPTKLLAATATIERYDEQVRNLYARRAKVFPSAGWDLEFSFYTQLTHQARRLYVGALPMLRDAAEFGGRVQGLLHGEVERLQNDLAGAVDQLGLDFIGSEDELRDQLFLYELSLGYVNRKDDGNKIFDELRGYARIGARDELFVQALSSDAVTLSDIAAILRRIEDETVDAPDRAERLRAVIGTSIVSHGVDINRLNCMVVNWMPPAIASYIQASSRVGRSHVGLVIVGHDRVNLRDRSFFHLFLPNHYFLERMVAPVPVNRFAKFATSRTMPGVVAAVILQYYARQTGRLQSLSRRDGFIAWWNEATPQERTDGLVERALDCLGLVRQLVTSDGKAEKVFDQTMVQSLQHDATQEVLDIIEDLKGAPADKLIDMFTVPPLKSFRDVDEPLEVSSFGKSEAAIHKLID